MVRAEAAKPPLAQAAVFGAPRNPVMQLCGAFFTEGLGLKLCLALTPLTDLRLKEKIMKCSTIGIGAIAAALLCLPAAAQQNDQAKGSVININVSRSIQTVNYWARGSTKVDFKGTALLPRAEGQAKVESKNGSLSIEAEFKGLQAPGSFGPEYLVYVLWAITPEGRANNLGQLVVKGDKSQADVTTRLQTFGMIVTAEPDFAVTFPSEAVVIENTARSDTKGAVDAVDANIEILKRGRYSEAKLEAFSMDPNIPLDLYQARNAVRIAKWEQADKYAAESFSKAQQALDRAEDYQKRKQKKAVPTAAREAVQMAEDARFIGAKRQEEERVANEQRAAEERTIQAKAEQEAEAKRRAEAEKQQANAEKQQANAERQQAEAEKQKTEAERQKLAAELNAAKEAQARAEAEKARAEAQAKEKTAQENALREREAAEKSEREKHELRAKLLEQFNRVLPTHDTPRGLVVNMGDVLFDTGKADLRSNAREALAKLSGTILNYPSLKLDIEGHTDSVGSDEFNQKLSEKRAEAVRGYLATQGIDAAAMAARGLGKNMPVEDNKTAAGRQKNRRVEIIVSGEVIGTKIGGQ
jgi:outer membrane protein OmpA-like peptidoglycan-associated protein